ncbi:MAG: site-2 protease family protein [Spirochaetales bacterium]|nr:site-2 protease family protein [Spirochaetales bacterium]
MTFVIGLVALGFLIFFHECGHFLMARLCGVTVEAFSVGMGPVLLHKKIKNTDYRLSLIPLGGYCAMKGEQDFQLAIENNEKVITGEPDSFYGIHPLKRLLIAFAGPFFNLVFAFAAFTVIALTGYTYYSAGNKVSMADEIYQDITSPAHLSGMETGDEIVEIDGTKMECFADIVTYVSSRPDKDLKIKVKRNDQFLTFTVHSILDKETGSGKIGIVSDSNSIIAREYPSHSFFPALKEGVLKTGEMTFLTVKSIATLFKGVKLTNALSGPVRISEIVGSAVKEGFSESFHAGFVSALQLMALISVSLFITNLLPIPVLDGGLILFAFIEWVSRRKLNPKFLLYIQYAGVTIIFLLMFIAISGDIMYLLRK